MSSEVLLGASAPGRDARPGAGARPAHSQAARGLRAGGRRTASRVRPMSRSRWSSSLASWHAARWRASRSITARTNRRDGRGTRGAPPRGSRRRRRGRSLQETERSWVSPSCSVSSRVGSIGGAFRTSLRRRVGVPAHCVRISRRSERSGSSLGCFYGRGRPRVLTAGRSFAYHCPPQPPGAALAHVLRPLRARRGSP